MRAFLHHTSLKLATTNGTFEVMRPCSAFFYNCRSPRDSSYVSSFAALQQVRLSLCMSEMWDTVPAKVEVLGRGNVQLRIRAETVTKWIATPTVLPPPSGIGQAKQPKFNVDRA